MEQITSVDAEKNEFEDGFESEKLAEMETTDRQNLLARIKQTHC